MADGGALWNRREFSCDRSVFESNVLRKDIDEDLVTEVVNKMSILKRNFGKPALWSQVSILQAVIYKHHNQHRKEKYFQGLKRVHKFLKRLQELEIHKCITQVIQQFPRVGSRVARDTDPVHFPSVQMISHLLVSLMGFAKLTLHTIAMCEETVKTLLKDLLQDTLDCYKVTRPWIKLLGEPNEVESDNTNLPECLEAWLAPDNNTAAKGSITRNSSKKVSTPVTSSTLLEKLFASTPGPCTIDLSPQRENIRDIAECGPLQDVQSLRSPAAATADLGEPVVSLGGSFIDEVKMQQRKGKETPTSLDEKNVRAKHDPLPTNKWQSLESRRPAKNERKPDEVRKGCSGRLSKSEGKLRDRFPRFRTASSPAMRIRERCRKLLSRRQCGAKGESLRCGITNSSRDENRRTKGSKEMIKTNKSKKSGDRDWTINSKSLATGKNKLGETTEEKNAQDEISLGKDWDLDTGAKFVPQRKRSLEYTRNSKKFKMMDLGEGRLQMSKSPQGTLGRAEFNNTDGLSPVQRQRDDVDDIFSLLEV